MSLPTFESIKADFAANHLVFSENWLRACYDWTKNGPTNDLTPEAMKSHIKQQWRFVNLEEIGCHCLPPRLCEQRVIELTGKYSLQMNYIRDIGESSYSQYSKIKKLESENTTVEAVESTQIPAWEPKPRRCLYLTLTDGSQRISGMEAERIDSLNLSIKPGCKLYICGPVICRRGVLLLKPSNISVIGGCVEAFGKPNSIEAILNGILYPPKDNSATTSSTTKSTITRVDKPKAIARIPPILAAVVASSGSNATVERKGRTRAPRKNPSTTTQLGNARSNSTEAFNSSDDDLFLSDEISNRLVDTDLLQDSPEIVILQEKPPGTTKAPRLTTLIQPKIVPSVPYQYIKQITTGQFKFGDTITIKGIVSTLISNIEIDKISGEWKLDVMVNDGSGYLVARVAPTIMEKMIGFSPAQMKQLKASTSHAEKARVPQGMTKLTNSLVHFNGLIRIKIISMNENMIIAMNDFTNDDVHELVTRTSIFTQ